MVLLAAAEASVDEPGIALCNSPAGSGLVVLVTASEDQFSLLESSLTPNCE